MGIKERFDEINRRLDEIARLLQTRQPAPNATLEVLSLTAAASYLGVAPRTLRNRKAGTGAIPRYSDRPVQFLRANLDQFKRARVERNARRSQEPARKLSLIRRKKTA